MKYYSTNRKASDATLEEAVVKGLAADRGLYMPHNIRILPASFYEQIDPVSYTHLTLPTICSV